MSTGDCRYGGSSGFTIVESSTLKTKSECQALCEANGNCVAYDRDTNVDSTPDGCYLFALPPGESAYSGNGLASHACYVRSGASPWAVLKSYGGLSTGCTGGCSGFPMEIDRCYLFPTAEDASGTQTKMSSNFVQTVAGTSGTWSVYTSQDCSGSAVASQAITYDTCVMSNLFDGGYGTASFSTDNTPSVGTCSANTGMPLPGTIRIWPSSTGCSSSGSCYAISLATVSGTSQATAECIKLDGCVNCGSSAKVWQENSYTVNSPMFSVNLYTSTDCSGSILKQLFEMTTAGGICTNKDTWSVQPVSGISNAGSCTIVADNSGTYARMVSLTVVGLVGAVAAVLLV